MGHTLAFKVVGEQRNPLGGPVVRYAGGDVRVLRHRPKKAAASGSKYPDPPGSVMTGGNYREVVYSYVQPDGTEGFTYEQFEAMRREMTACPRCRFAGDLVDKRRAPGS